MNSSLFDYASFAVGLGISIVPPMEDGTKRPGTGYWTRYQSERASPDEISRWYGPATGLGLVCGSVSRGLELFDFDCGETYRKFVETARALGGGDLVDRIEGGYLEATPGGGVHWFYYSEEIRGSTKLATRPVAEGQVKTLIETKGEHGYAVIAPSFGQVHPSGKPYRLMRGDLSSIVTISGVERDWLWELARSFHESLREAEAAKAGATHKVSPEDEVSPGDDYNARAKWRDVLDGWTFVYKHGDTDYVRRPGKGEGVSATINHTGTDRLHVFTSSTAFEPSQSYSKFGAYCVLRHGGDFAAAARALYREGYGTRKEPAKPKAEGKALRNGEARAEELTDLTACSDEVLGIHDSDRIDPEPIVWEWGNRVARGKINLLAGEGGDGKSQIATAIIAAISTGGLFPDGTQAERGTCFILSAEDGAKDTIIPRLIAAGADRQRVKLLTAKLTVKDKNGKPLVSPMSFQDLGYWRAVLSRHGGRLLVADPVPAYLGRGVNDHRNNEVRAILEPFGDLLSELCVGMWAITHLNKSSDAKSPMHKILGSVAYYNISRTVHYTTRDPDNPDRRFFAWGKANITEPQPTLAFRIVPFEFAHNEVIIKTSRLEFEAASVVEDTAAIVTGAERKAPPGPAPSLGLAEWLHDLLWGNGWMPVSQVFNEAGEAGLIGAQKEDGRWSNVNLIYRARDRVHKLPAPKDGCTVDDCTMPFRGFGKNTPHWKLSKLDDPLP